MCIYIIEWAKFEAKKLLYFSLTSATTVHHVIENLSDLLLKTSLSRHNSFRSLPGIEKIV